MLQALGSAAHLKEKEVLKRVRQDMMEMEEAVSRGSWFNVFASARRPATD